MANPYYGGTAFETDSGGPVNMTSIQTAGSWTNDLNIALNVYARITLTGLGATASTITVTLGLGATPTNQSITTFAKEQDQTAAFEQTRPITVKAGETLQVQLTSTADTAVTYAVDFFEDGTHLPAGAILFNCDSSTTTTIVDASLSSTDDLYNNKLVTILSGTNANESATVTDYTGSSGTLTVGTMTSAATAGATVKMV